MDPNQKFLNLDDKLNEMNDLFHFSEKIIPFVKNLIDFMREIVPMIESVNRSIAESTNKIPSAANQLNSVTEATEMATTEILDKVDSIAAVIEEMETTLEKLSAKKEERQKIVDLLKSEINFTEKQEQLLDNLVVDQEIDILKDKLVFLQDESYQITMSLQVQDITSQQLASVNNLIDSVHKRLSYLVGEISEAELNESDNGTDASGTFDSNARYNKDTTKQQEIDDMFAGEQKNETTSSQDEIDKLFSGD